MGNFKQLVFVSTLIAITSTSLSAANNAEMIKSIMKLRTDVEGLYSKIDENKDNYKSQMKSYAMQAADNEAQINRKKTALKLANAEMKKLDETIAEKSATSSDLTPMLTTALDNLATIIKTGIPFKVDERIADIEKIKSDVKSGDITQEKALSLTWASYDDVLRLTKEIGIFKQQINVDGEEKLAKVAKIGSTMLFFITPDEQIGYAKKRGDKYVFVTVDDIESKKEIHDLFDALLKQIRTGYFTLPNALLVSGVK